MLSLHHSDHRKVQQNQTSYSKYRGVAHGNVCAQARCNSHDDFTILSVRLKVPAQEALQSLSRRERRWGVHI